jgi:hypothetical protein
MITATGSRPRLATVLRVSIWAWSLVSIGAFVVLYPALVVALVVAGRRESARGVAGFIPDCVVLCGRLLRDPDRVAVRIPFPHGTEPKAVTSTPSDVWITVGNPKDDM